MKLTRSQEALKKAAQAAGIEYLYLEPWEPRRMVFESAASPSAILELVGIVEAAPAAPESLPEADHDVVGRGALNQFIDRYCKDNTVLAACATDAFYWFNKVAAAELAK